MLAVLGDLNALDEIIDSAGVIATGLGIIILADLDGNGSYLVTLPHNVLDRKKAMRGPERAIPTRSCDWRTSVVSQFGAPFAFRVSRHCRLYS